MKKTLSVKQKVGIRIKELRESRGDTQESLAEKLDTTKESISRLERGVHYLSDTMLSALCKEYKVKESFFYIFETIVRPDAEKVDFINAVNDKLGKCSTEDVKKINRIVDVFLPPQ